MPLLNSYAVWNNKGGVGKSTVSFHLASRYAEKHPNQKVLVIDMCPQANVSMLLLGGGLIGEQRVLRLCTEATPKTVVGYLSTVLASGAGAPLPNPSSYLVKPSIDNQALPSNLFLLCGDGNLEPMAPAIAAEASRPALVPTIQPWVWVHEILRGIIDNVATDDDAEWMVFIDTNPSFSIYTELAVSAAHRLIVPVNADDSSRVATNAMMILLHGQTPPHPIYGSWTFASQAIAKGLSVPAIHIVVGNRLTQYQGAATAFKALSDATATTLFDSYLKNPSFFTSRTMTINSVDTFRSAYSIALRDFNTAGVVAAHSGKPLSKLNDGNHQVHGTSVNVDGRRVEECSAALDELVNLID